MNSLNSEDAAPSTGLVHLVKNVIVIIIVATAVAAAIKLSLSLLKHNLCLACSLIACTVIQ